MIDVSTTDCIYAFKFVDTGTGWDTDRSLISLRQEFENHGYFILESGINGMHKNTRIWVVAKRLAREVYDFAAVSTTQAHAKAQEGAEVYQTL